MELEARAAGRRALGADLKVCGPIRVGTSELLGFYFLRLLRTFPSRYPDLEIDISINNELATSCGKMPMSSCGPPTRRPGTSLGWRIRRRRAYYASTYQAYVIGSDSI
jgi:hypothetical protein